MTELKTLKDFERCTLCDCDINSSVDLKQEAIKRIKYLREQQKECKHGDAVYYPACNECQKEARGGIIVFKDFFNITDEDLK